MEYKRIEQSIILRLDPGEEIVSSILALAEQENIRLAEINALGATNDFTVGVYNLEEQKFYPNHFTGAYEISSLHGTITTMDGRPYLHLHMNAANENGQAYGGHLKEAFISATFEGVIRILDGTVERRQDEVTGLNILAF